MDTDKRVAPPISYVFLFLCNTCDVASFATQNSKQTVLTLLTKEIGVCQSNEQERLSSLLTKIISTQQH